MKLNSGQTAAVDGVIDAFDQSHATPGQGRTIIGEGGTGKTFAVMNIGQQLADADYRIIFTAPTNKAVKQLEKTAREWGLKASEQVEFKTIYSALGLSVMPSAEQKYTARVREAVVNKYDMVVLDEASMANKPLLYSHLLPELAMSERSTFLLPMGDSFQLPPVKEIKSLAFDLYPCYELTQNERVLVNPDGSVNSILALCHQLRAAIGADRPFDVKLKSDQNITIHRATDFLQAVTDSFNIDTDLENTRVVAWTNERVDDINRVIRKKIYGEGADRFVVGERIVTGGPIKDEEGNIVLSTDEECIVTAVSPSSIYDERGDTTWNTICLCLQPIYANVSQVFAHVVDEGQATEYRRHLEALADKAKKQPKGQQGMYWRFFHEFKELFADIKYCYAITIHRCQGSSYDTTIVDVKNIMLNPRRSERQRLIYVGFSRARRHLILNKSEFIA